MYYCKWLVIFLCLISPLIHETVYYSIPMNQYRDVYTLIRLPKGYVMLLLEYSVSVNVKIDLHYESKILSFYFLAIDPTMSFILCSEILFLLNFVFNIIKNVVCFQVKCVLFKQKHVHFQNGLVHRCRNIWVIYGSCSSLSSNRNSKHFSNGMASNNIVLHQIFTYSSY